LIYGGGTIKALSAEFLGDLQQHWRKHRQQVLDDVAKKHPQQYFAGMVAWRASCAGRSALRDFAFPTCGSCRASTS
jgi:hypothetical protein